MWVVNHEIKHWLVPGSSELLSSRGGGRRGEEDGEGEGEGKKTSEHGTSSMVRTV